jgi:glycosyltransferase involved in cell wall biosynthesis
LIEKGLEIRIISESNHSKLISNEIPIVLESKPLIDNEFITKLCITTLSYPANEVLWIQQGKKIFKNIIKSWRPDFIMVLTSAGGLHLIELGRILSKAYKIKLYIHSTDPMPAPVMWKEKPPLRRGIRNIMRRCFRQASLFSLSNETMLNYQLKMIGEDKKENSFVVHNPVRGPFVKRDNSTEPFNFLYLGSIYFNRSPDKIIQAFLEFAINQPNVRLQFVGKMFPDLPDLVIPENLSHFIEILPWTDNPDDYIKKASVLVDFDAPYENDVFISSKLIKYLNSDVPILSITCKNSPSEILLGEIKESAVVTDYDHKRMISAFEKIFLIAQKKHSNEIEKERALIISRFLYHNVTGLIANKLNAQYF